MKVNNIELIEAELERIRLENDGMLNPHTVVEVAREPENVLHGHFTWDDTEAAEKYRLWQARKLINTIVTILPNETTSVRMYVSLKDDRDDEGGYRGLVDVLSDDEMRVRLLKEAFSEFNHFKMKYNHLKALAPVFKAMEKVEETVLQEA